MPPTVTARQNPAGQRLKKGHKCLVAFSLDPDIALWEIDPKPPGQSGGDMIDITTQHNTTRRQFEPRNLITDTDGSMSCAYDPRVVPQLTAILNKKGAVTFHYPNGDSVSWWAVLREAEPDGMTEDGMPTMTITISPTNTHPTTGAEEGPLLIEVAGTGT